MNQRHSSLSFFILLHKMPQYFYSIIKKIKYHFVLTAEKMKRPLS
jgi:hypothetical protein